MSPIEGYERYVSLLDPELGIDASYCADELDQIVAAQLQLRAAL